MRPIQRNYHPTWVPYLFQLPCEYSIEKLSLAKNELTPLSPSYTRRRVYVVLGIVEMLFEDMKRYRTQIEKGYDELRHTDKGRIKLKESY
jgi:hypothetical protein